MSPAAMTKVQPVEFWENCAFQPRRLCKPLGIVLTTALHEIAENGVSAALPTLHQKVKA